MSEANKSIHEFDFKLICEYYSGLERQGPGSPEVTIKALNFIDNLTAESRIADIGWGTGGARRPPPVPHRTAAPLGAGGCRERAAEASL